MQVYVRAFVTTALCLLQPTHTEGNAGDVPLPLGGDAPEAEATTAATRANVTATTTGSEQEAEQLRGLGLPCARDGDCLASRGLSCQEWQCTCAPESPVRVRDDGADTCLPAKSLYESCRYHEECSHRSANLRCVDFLCYCPLPFELRGNGDCLEPRQSMTKLIAAVTPTTILLITTLALGAAFIFRRLFSDRKTAGSQGDRDRPWEHPNTARGRSRSRTATTSISIRTRTPMVTHHYGRRRTSSQSNVGRTAAPPLPRLIRWPPDRALKANSFSPELMSTTTALRSAAATPTGASKQSSLQSPSPLSTSRLVEKLLTSSIDSADDDGIIIRIHREDKSAPAAALSKPPFGRQGSLIPLPGSQAREMSRFRKADHNREERSASLPIEWGTLATSRENVLGISAPLPSSANSGRNDGMHLQGNVKDAPGFTEFRFSRRQSKGVTFADEASSKALVSDNYKSQDGVRSVSFLTPKKLESSSRVDQGGLGLGSLKAGARWQSQSARPLSAQDKEGVSGHRDQGKSAPPFAAMNDLLASRADYHNAVDSRDPAVPRQSPTLAERNRLGVGTPFVDEGPLSESASVALSFLTSSSSSDELLPRPDIESAALRAAEPPPKEGAAAREEDARLVEQFMAAALEDASSSDVAPTALVFSGTAQAGHNEAQVARMIKARWGYTDLPGPPAPTLKHFFPVPTTALKEKGAAASTGEPEKGSEQATASTDQRIPTPKALDKDAQAESTSSSTDIENLTEILTSIKVTQLGNQHHRRERTLLREYSVEAKDRETPVGPLGTPASTAGAARSPRQCNSVVATSSAVPTSPKAEHAALVPVPAARAGTALPVPPPSSAASEPEMLPALSMLLPLTESAEFTGQISARQEVSGVRRSSGEPPTPVAAQNPSKETGGEPSSPSEQRRRPSVAQLHRARTANSRLVPPAAVPFRPTPLKRSIRYRRTTSSQLQVISEALHGVEMSRPPVPLRTKVPFKGEGEAFSSTTKADPVSQLQDDAELEREGCVAKRFASLEAQANSADRSSEPSSTALDQALTACLLTYQGAVYLFIGHHLVVKTSSLLR
ncbi:hypothetical protein V5799_019308 [Amblyomma americanum]|uniref:EB domain-containing protein n=1 Tax=Amblyomma americanum TaxID=6943 RepID=A0AAQ4EXB7_AMBAM